MPRDDIKQSIGSTLEKILISIGVLLPVLVLTIVWRYVLGSEPPKSPEPPPSSQTAVSVELAAKEGYIVVPYDVKDILPGDSVTQCYCITVTHEKAETVRFGIDVDAAQKLSDVARVMVEQVVPDAESKVLYNGLMTDCTAVDTDITASTKTVTPIYYRITVYTNGAEVGNEYRGESLAANFLWQIQ